MHNIDPGSFTTLIQTLRYIFEIGEDNDGQIIIYTNCYMGDDDFPILFPNDPFIPAGEPGSAN